MNEESKTKPGALGGTDHHHPSFGVITAHRVTGHKRLFGSEVDAGGWVRIEVREGYLNEDAYMDRIGPARKMLIQVDMSEAQWAQFLSRPNMGDGTPCTLSMRPVGGTLESCTVPGKETADERMGRRVSEMDQANRDGIEAWSSKLLDIAEKALGKKALEEFKRTLSCLVDHQKSNQDYALKTLTEHKEKLVSKMRVEIEAMLTDRITQLGLAKTGETQKVIEQGE